MTITVGWDDVSARRTLRYDVEDRWTWTELKKALDAGKKLAETIEGQVNLIFCLKPGSRAPIAKPHEIRALSTIDEDKVRLIATVSTDLFIKAMTQAFRSTYPGVGRRMCLLPTLEAAHEHIAQSYAVAGHNSAHALP